MVELLFHLKQQTCICEQYTNIPGKFFVSGFAVQINSQSGSFCIWLDEVQLCKQLVIEVQPYFV